MLVSLVLIGGCFVLVGFCEFCLRSYGFRVRGVRFGWFALIASVLICEVAVRFA